MNVPHRLGNHVNATAVAIPRWRLAPWRLPLIFRGAGLAAFVAVLASLIPAIPLAGGPVSGKADPALLAAGRAAGPSSIGVIVRETDPRSSAAEELVRSLGGTVTRKLRIIGAFAARVPGEDMSSLAGSPSVLRLWGDGRVHMTGDVSQINNNTAANTVWQQVIRLGQAQSNYNGAGVTVALLDTGVTQVPDVGNRVLARVDLTPEHDGYDHYGHGTHMAGIIMGDGASSNGQWRGVAPAANLVSVKVAGVNGATDVSVVIAGLQWIVNNRQKYNIRVLNLSFGTDSTQSYLIDPLDYAVEQVWFSGVLVVVAAGNRGPSAGTVNKPADDPFVLTVGAADLKNTTVRSDDVVADFSSRGPTQDGLSKPALIAPGVTIVSDRAPGSTIDEQFPSARVGDSYFKGTGTSQAAAVVSGVAAMMFQANPTLNPDLAKAMLVGSASKNMAGQSGAGAGLVDAAGAVQVATSLNYLPANQGIPRSTGLGSLELSRGSVHVYADLPQDGLNQLDADAHLDLVVGGIDVLGQPWAATGWSATGWSATGWASIAWEATGWSATGWSATGWSATGWSATGWSGASWTATGWSATGWSATGWSATGWSATGWSGGAWS